MELTTRIFTDLAKVAKWAFNATLAKSGTYTLTEILRDKTGAFLVQDELLDFSKLPECAERANDYNDTIRLSYNDGASVYELRASGVFYLMNKFKSLAKVKTTEKAAMCTFVKNGDEGELIAIYDMPKTKTKAMAKAAANDDIRPVMNGVYLDKEGYAVASDGRILSVISVNCEVHESYSGAIIPTQAAKRADGKCIEIYRNKYDRLTAKVDGEVYDCIEGRYPNYRSVLPSIPVENGISIKSRDLTKMLPKKTKYVNLSWEADTLNVGYTDDEDNEVTKGVQAKGVPFSGIFDFSIIKRIMPGCTMMYPTESTRPMVFLGDGMASMVMPCRDDNKCYDNRNGKMVDFLTAINPDALEVNEKKEEAQTVETAIQVSDEKEEKRTSATVNPNGQTETIQEGEKTEKGESLEPCRLMMLAYYTTNNIIRLNDRAGETQRLAVITTADSQSVQARHSITGVPYAIFLPLRAQNAISRIFVPITYKNLVWAKYHGKLPHNTSNVSYHLARGPTQKAA